MCNKIQGIMTMSIYIKKYIYSRLAKNITNIKPKFINSTSYI